MLPHLRSASRAWPVALSLLVPLSGAAAQSATPQSTAPRANWTLAERFGQNGLRNAVYSTAVQPRWLGETDSMFYNWRDRNGSRFYLVVPTARVKRPLFDHVKLAAALSELHRRPYDPQNLPFTNITFTKDHRNFRFNVDSSRYEWNLAGETLKSLPRLRRDSIPQDEERQAVGGGGQGGGGGGGGFGGGAGADFRNFSPDSTAFVFARDHNLYLVEVATKDTVQISTDGVRNHSFGFRDTTQQNQQQQQQQQQDNDNDGDQQSRSRDPRVRANVIWSPDSKAFVVQRNDSRKVKELYLVNVLSNPRPTLSSYTYAMPGETDVPQQEIYVFKRGQRAIVPVNVSKWKDQRLMNLHWPSATNTDKLRLMRRDRLQRNLELIEVDLASGAVKPLITESVENANLEVQNARYTKTGGDIIWWSERSGWGHYYLYANDGTYKRPLTSGAWRAENILQIDSTRGLVYVSGVGREDGENPYYSHVYRVNADGTGFTLLNSGNYHYVSAMSPTKRYLVENYSRIDTAPVSIVRDAATGQVAMRLESMDMTRLKEMGWKAPERFVVKAADGITDIYGNMWKPFDFDSTKKYPIIAHVYPGPQTEGVNTGFGATGVPQQLAQLGFIVVQLGNRGGTPQRSNAYQSFSYFNMRDYALADKKTGLEQLAARHPFIDISKVGIFGHSGGGFLTGAAMMLPPYNDFFKVGVSSAGNHDNNIYNQNWSEQYHGLRIATDTGRGRGQQRAGGAMGAGQNQRRDVVTPPPTRAAAVGDPQDSVRFSIRVPTNPELAENLKGKLLLVHGDMDNNVHPGNTIRLVDALIKANKRFDMMIMPGQAHGFGPMQPYFNRMLMEYFAEHLLGDNYRGTAEIR